MLTLALLSSKGIGATFHSNHFRTACPFCRYVLMSENGTDFYAPELIAFICETLNPLCDKLAQ